MHCDVNFLHCTALPICNKICLCSCLSLTIKIQLVDYRQLHPCMASLLCALECNRWAPQARTDPVLLRGHAAIMIGIQLVDSTNVNTPMYMCICIYIYIYIYIDMCIICMCVYNACMPGRAAPIIGMPFMDTTNFHPIGTQLVDTTNVRPTPPFKCRCPMRNAARRPCLFNSRRQRLMR